MNDEHRKAAKAQLSTLIGRVMEDGKVDDAERAELQRFYAENLLNVSDVKEVFGRYLSAMQRQVLADGVVTTDESKRCKAVIESLRIPLRLLSPELLKIVVERPKE